MRTIRRSSFVKTSPKSLESQRMYQRRYKEKRSGALAVSQLMMVVVTIISVVVSLAVLIQGIVLVIVFNDHLRYQSNHAQMHAKITLGEFFTCKLYIYIKLVYSLKLFTFQLKLGLFSSREQINEFFKF